MKKVYARFVGIFLLVLLAVFGRAQQASIYTFASTSGTYTPLGGTATAVSAIVGDDFFSSSIPIGFTFRFGNTNYTSLYANSNGFLAFSSATATSSQQRNNSTANLGIIGPSVFALWDDQIGFTSSPASSVARYEVTGTAGSRVFTFEWKNWIWFYTSTNSTAVISYQIKLYEGTNIVEFVYQSESGSIIGTPTATIGIGTSSTDYLTLSGTGASPTASSSTFTTSLATKPATGQIYKFTPPPPLRCTHCTTYRVNTYTNGYFCEWYFHCRKSCC